MLSVPTEFPHPGSFGLFADDLGGVHSWRILRANADGTLTICRAETASASGHRTVEASALIDPASRAALREDAPLALRLAHALRNRDEVPLATAMDIALRLKALHDLALPITPGRLSDILRDLGWRRERDPQGITYRRIATPLRTGQAA